MNFNTICNVRQLQDKISNDLQTDENETKEIARLIGVYNGLDSYFQKYPEDLSNSLKNRLDKAERALDYTRPYRIVIIGRTGVGKSTFANALLSRDLVLTKPIGEAATGTVLEIYQTAESDDKEYAEVHYRSGADIRDLIEKKFVNRFELSSDLSKNLLDASDSDAIDKTLADIDRSGNDFSQVKDSIADIVKQHISHGTDQENRTERFDLDSSQLQDLNNLIDENSEMNRGPSRKIGLIKKVVYHIYPQQSENQTVLQLPRNACLIDLPGINATLLHDEIITRDAREADAAVFIFNPARMNQLGETRMMGSLRGNIGISRPEQIFIVFNKWDRIHKADKGNDELSRVANNIAMEVSPTGTLPERVDSNLFFPTNASAACLARKAATGTIVPDESDLYNTFRESPGATPEDVLNKSGIPGIVDALNGLASNNIKTQITDAQSNLMFISKTLKDKHGSEIGVWDKTAEKEKADLLTQFNNSLNEVKKKMKDVVSDFRWKEMQPENQAALESTLQGTSKKICDLVDQELTTSCSQLWRDAHHEQVDLMIDEKSYELDKHEFLSAINVQICHLLSEYLDKLTHTIAIHYREAFEKEKVQADVRNAAFNISGSENIFSTETIEGIVKKLEENLKQVSKRIAVTWLFNPKNYIWQKDDGQGRDEHREKDGGWPWERESSEESAAEESAASDIPSSEVQGNTKMEELLNDIARSTREKAVAEDEPPRIPELDKGNTAKIVKAVREHYSPFVSDRSVQALLNVYSYETLVARESMDECIETWITSTRTQHTDSETIASLEIPQMARFNKKLEQARLRKEKLDYLNALSDSKIDLEALFKLSPKPQADVA